MNPHIAIQLKLMRSPRWYYEVIIQIRKDLKESNEVKFIQLEIF